MVEILILPRFTELRFRLRVTCSTALAALTTIFAPIFIVLFTDERCAYHYFFPLQPISAVVSVSFCRVYTNGLCTSYSDDIITSTYGPQFFYQGELCASAVLSVYAPVFLVSVLLSAVLPASVDLIFVPWLAKSHKFKLASLLLGLLEPVSLLHFDHLVHDHEESPRRAPDLVDRAQRIVERGLTQLLVTLLIALTFGIAVPMVGASCVVASTVQLMHYQHVLSIIIGLKTDSVSQSLNYTRVPKSVFGMLTIVVLLVWTCLSFGYLDLACVSGGISSVVVGAASLAWALHRFTSLELQNSLKSLGLLSTDRAPKLLLESLLLSDESLGDDDGDA
jgi:hypothetical protein